VLFAIMVQMFVVRWRGHGIMFLNGRVFIPVDEFGKRYWRSIGVQVLSKEDNYHGANILLRASARIRVPD